MVADRKRQFETEAERCRHKARRCHELAVNAHLDGVKDMLLLMALDFEKRASDAEASNAKSVA